MLVCFTTGISFWLVYGLARASWPIVVSNAITLVLSAMLLFLKCRS
jgi:MtN3 and saliva related transmembrane protein